VPSESPVAKPHGTAQRVRVIIFRVVAALAGLFFVVAVVLMASAPWAAPRVFWSSSAGPARARSQRASGISWKDVTSAISARRVSCPDAEG
jgi:hypothetical protein